MLNYGTVELSLYMRYFLALEVESSDILNLPICWLYCQICGLLGNCFHFLKQYSCFFGQGYYFYLILTWSNISFSQETVMEKELEIIYRWEYSLDMNRSHRIKHNTSLTVVLFGNWCFQVLNKVLVCLNWGACCQCWIQLYVLETVNSRFIR